MYEGLPSSLHHNTQPERLFLCVVCGKHSHGRSRLSRLLEPTSGMVLVPQVWCKGHLCLAERSHRLALCNSGALLSKQSPQIQEGFQESLCSRQG